MRWTVREVQVDDTPVLRAILQKWLGAGAEAGLARILAADDEHHVVAVDDDGAVAGVMGIELAGINPPLFSDDDVPASLISACVAEDRRGQGAGTTLADHLEAWAVERGCTRLVVVSGSRSRDVGYPFWTQRYGEMALVEHDYFGPGQELVAWSVALPR